MHVLLTLQPISGRNQTPNFALVWFRLGAQPSLHMNWLKDSASVLNRNCVLMNYLIMISLRRMRASVPIISYPEDNITLRQNMNGAVRSTDFYAVVPFLL